MGLPYMLDPPGTHPSPTEPQVRYLEVYRVTAVEILYSRIA